MKRKLAKRNKQALTRLLKSKPDHHPFDTWLKVLWSNGWIKGARRREAAFVRQEQQGMHNIGWMREDASDFRKMSRKQRAQYLIKWEPYRAVLHARIGKNGAFPLSDEAMKLADLNPGDIVAFNVAGSKSASMQKHSEQDLTDEEIEKHGSLARIVKLNPDDFE